MKDTLNLSAAPASTPSLIHKVTSLDELRRTALQQLQHIQQQEKTLIQVQSNLDLLMKRYNVEKGLFSRAAEWYGSQAWWIKIILGLIFVGIATGIGALLHMPIALACAGCGIYLLLAFLFINHYLATEKRNKRLCEDVLEMEHSLNETITHFATLSDSLKKVMLSLCEMNCQMTQHVEALADQQQQLGEKITTYQIMVKELTDTKTQLTEQLNKIIQNLQQADTLFHATHDAVSTQSQTWLQTAKNISTLHAHLVEDEVSLRQKTDALHNITTLITQCHDEFQPILATFNQAIHLMSPSPPPSTEALPPLESQYHSQLSRLDTILTQAQTTLKQTQESLQQHAIENNSVVTCIHQTQSVTLRAQALLQKIAGQKAIHHISSAMTY